MDMNEWLNNIKSVSPSPILPQAAMAPAAAAVASGNGYEDSDDYIRIGRRTTEDEDGDIPTQFIVVAKIDAIKQKLTWLSVATWQFNGLRIGSLHAGDHVRENDDSFNLSTGLDPDPYFFAQNVLSPKRIREHLLELLSQSNVRVLPETYDEDIAQDERNHAQWARMIKDHGMDVISSEEMRVVAGQDPAQRFPHPWALPTVLEDSWDTSFIGIKPGPTRARRRHAKQQWLPTFDGVSKASETSPINAIVVFVNDFHDGNLRLKHFVQTDLDSDESIEAAREYFLEGDGTAGSGFTGLNNNPFLARMEWSLELWVLPQVEGCSTLIKWDDVPQLEARAFCDWRAIQKDGGKCDPQVQDHV